MIDQKTQEMRLKTAINNAGNRYSTAVNLQVQNILKNLYALNREPEYLTDLLGLAYKVRRMARYLGNHTDKETEIKQLQAEVKVIVNRLVGLKAKTKYQNIRWASTSKLIKRSAAQSYELYSLFRQRKEDKQKEKPYDSTDYGASNMWELYSALEELQRFLDDFRPMLFNKPRMILRGEAGIGKTHLLCDYAKARVESGKPTLMFLAHELLGTQGKNHPLECMALLLGYNNSSSFIADLRLLSKNSESRVCLIIDAVNEADSLKWVELAQLFDIQGLSLVVSVRNGYERIVKDSGKYTTVQHFGFAEMEWEAISTFFKYYKMEMPEIPIIDPEFKNPLFLKIFCESYAGKKDKTPRGHGATHVFEQYVETQSKKVLRELGLRLQKDYLWKHVIKEMGVWMGKNGKAIMLRPKLLEIVARDANLSPHISRLIALMEHHDLLIKYPRYTKDGKRKGYGYSFTYNRFSDHLIVRSILTENKIDSPNAAKAFFQQSSFLPRNRYNSGLMEALAIQIPERCKGHELTWLVPKKYRGYWTMKMAFIEGLKWRDVASIDKQTGALKFMDTDQVRKYMNKYFHDTEQDEHIVLNCMLDVCAIPSHPFNADRLHKLLSRHALGKRDAWWQYFLLDHEDGSGNAVERLQSWSLSELPQKASPDSVRLAAVALSWTLASSNRRLRDRSSRALVSLLTHHQHVLLEILKQFADNNDPYITQRLFATAYGVLSLNPSERENFKNIAQWIYKHYFLNTKRRFDALMDDYAKGIIELYLRNYRNDIRARTKKITPPFSYYKFPKKIPTVKSLQKKYRGEDHNYYSIWGSLMYGEGGAGIADFGNYTMGYVLRGFSAVPLPAKPPKNIKAGHDAFLRSLSKQQRELLNTYTAQRFSRITFPWAEAMKSKKDVVEIEAKPTVSDSDIEKALRAFEKSLGPIRRFKYRKYGPYIRNEKRFNWKENDYDLNIARRWIFKRVIDLGWSPEDHETFDKHYSSHDRSRSAGTERIGKKYQWIALSEFLALLGSNYYYCEDKWSSGGDLTHYHGAYQTGLRDFDPTIDPLWLIGRKEDDDSTEVWWMPKYNKWHLKNWRYSTKDIPSPSQLIQANKDGVDYLNLLSWKTWKGETDAPEDKDNHNYPELWMHVNGYIVRKKDFPSVKKWCETKEFWNRALPEPNDGSSGVFLKEFADSSAYREVLGIYQERGGWSTKGDETPFDVLGPIEGYSSSSFESDDTVSNHVMLYAPNSFLRKTLKLRPAAKIGEYISVNGKLRFFDPSVDYTAHSALLVNKTRFLKELDKRGLAVFWTVLGEKMYLGEYGDGEFRGQRLEIHGYCYFDEDGKLVENTRFKDEWKAH